MCSVQDGNRKIVKFSVTCFDSSPNKFLLPLCYSVPVTATEIPMIGITCIVRYIFESRPVKSHSTGKTKTAAFARIQGKSIDSSMALQEIPIFYVTSFKENWENINCLSLHFSAWAYKFLVKCLYSNTSPILRQAHGKM